MWISRMALICGLKMKKKRNSEILNVRLPEFYSILPLMGVSIIRRIFVNCMIMNLTLI